MTHHLACRLLQLSVTSSAQHISITNSRTPVCALAVLSKFGTYRGRQRWSYYNSCLMWFMRQLHVSCYIEHFKFSIDLSHGTGTDWNKHRHMISSSTIINSLTGPAEKKLFDAICAKCLELEWPHWCSDNSNSWNSDEHGGCDIDDIT